MDGVERAEKHAKGYIEGLEMLASMRLCANVPAQHAIQTALGGYQASVNLLPTAVVFMSSVTARGN